MLFIAEPDFGLNTYHAYPAILFPEPFGLVVGGSRRS